MFWLLHNISKIQFTCGQNPSAFVAFRLVTFYPSLAPKYPASISPPLNPSSQQQHYLNATMAPKDTLVVDYVKESLRTEAAVVAAHKAAMLEAFKLDFKQNVDASHFPSFDLYTYAHISAGPRYLGADHERSQEPYERGGH